MVQTFRNAWKIPELRRKILFTLFIVLLYRLGNAVPVPYVDTNILATYFAQLKNTVQDFTTPCPAARSPWLPSLL